MIWQDIVLMLASFYFGAVQLPTLVDPDSSVPRRASVTTAIGLTVMAATYYSLGLTLAMVGAVVTAIVWAAIATLRPVTDERDIVEMITEDNNG